MKKEHELYVHKALALSKLALALVLLFVVVKAVILPLRGTTPLGPASVSGAENIGLFLNETYLAIQGLL
jgi:hypothetical protein